MIATLDVPVLAAYAGLAAVAVLAARRGVPPGAAFLGACVLALAVPVAAAEWTRDAFAAMRALAWLLFLAVPLGLAVLARVGVEGRGWRWPRWLAGGLSVAIALVAVDAFLVEPRWLTVRRFTLRSAKVTEPLRIAVLTDIQTDTPGDWERRAIRTALDADPDLLLLPGDYVQHERPDENARLRGELRAIFRDEGLEAPLGAVAVRGNVEHDPWRELFDGLPVTAVERTTVVPAGPVTVTALSFRDGFDPDTSVPDQAGFHVVVAHAPDFALGDVDADLLVAGHTHGGQVQLPIIGPLLTLSAVPRPWADGLTRLPSGAHLVVSRGIGMERDRAPRLRFLCRPEVVLIDVVPAGRD